MLASSNVHVSKGFSIFANTFNMAYRFETPIKGHRVMDSFVPLAVLSLRWVCMVKHCQMPPVLCFSDCS